MKAFLRSAKWNEHQPTAVSYTTNNVLQYSNDFRVQLLS